MDHYFAELSQRLPLLREVLAFFFFSILVLLSPSHDQIYTECIYGLDIVLMYNTSTFCSNPLNGVAADAV